MLIAEIIALQTKIFEAVLKGDINLGCYCAPTRSHCETIKHFIEINLNYFK